jgi:hypothetical protein
MRRAKDEARRKRRTTVIDSPRKPVQVLDRVRWFYGSFMACRPQRCTLPASARALFSSIRPKDRRHAFDRGQQVIGPGLGGKLGRLHAGEPVPELSKDRQRCV